MYGAVWSRSGEDLSLTAGGGELSDPLIEKPMSMNNGATPGGEVIVGLWNDTSRHGFVVRAGVFESYDVPSVSIKLTQSGTSTRKDSSSALTSTPPDGTASCRIPATPRPCQIDALGHTGTTVFGINPQGVLVGSYLIGTLSHGFIAVPVPTDRILAAQHEGGR
jgi:hypothetical protein